MQTRMKALRLFKNYDPYLESEIWESAFYHIDRISPKNRANFYVRFDLESLLRDCEVPFFPDLNSTYTVKDFLIEHHKVGEFQAMTSGQDNQIGKRNLVLTTAIRERLVGMKLFTRHY